MRVVNPAASRRTHLMLQGALILLLCLLPVRTALAVSAAQEGARPLLLGEFGRAPLGEGEAAEYALSIAADGAYTVVYVGDGAAEDFLLSVTNADGEELYNDVLQGETVVDLAEGDYVLTFTAQTAAELSFVVGVEGGTMTSDSEEPGELFNGSVYTTEDVREPRYADLTIESSGYPQQAVLLVQGGDGDVYQAEVYSEDFDYFSTTTDESEMLRFTTTGGVYELTITPLEGGSSLQVSVFLSGPAPALDWETETSGELTGYADVDTFQIDVGEAGTEVIISAAADDDTSSLTVTAGAMPDQQTWSTYGYGGEPTELSFIAPAAGVYYVNVSTDSESGSTYTILAEEAGMAATLPLGEPVSGSVSDGAKVGYLLQVDEPQQYVIVVLAGPEEQDLDLNIARFEDGEQVLSDNAASLSSREVAGVFADEPGTFIVVVDGSWAEDADFTILAFTGPLADLTAEIGSNASETGTAEEDTAAAPETPDEPAADGSIEQWAAFAEASSQYTDSSWSALQATGEADTVEAGDMETAWAAASPDTQEESLVLAYEQAVNPTAVEVYETYNPGAVTRIEVLDPNTDEWVVVWEGTAGTAGEEMAVFSPVLATVDFATSQVRLTIDEPALPGWNEIDAVKLIGIPE